MVVLNGISVLGKTSKLITNLFDYVIS